MALSDYTALSNKLRLQAQRALAKEMPERFTEIHNAIRSEHGLPEVGQGAAQLAQENAQLRREVEQLEKAQAGGTGRRTRANATA
jgi:hypothetical protein